MSETDTTPYASIFEDKPIGTDFDPTGGPLTPQEAVDRIAALRRKGQQVCYLPEDKHANDVNAGRVRALAQALMLLERAGLHPDESSAYLNDEEEMVVHA
jgi:hypothetical protein